MRRAAARRRGAIEGGLFALYGSYGYTGRLIARAAVEADLRPLLCGRDAARLSAQAALLGLEYAVAPLDDATAALGDAFSRVRAVLNCAGPIAGTVERVVTACLRAGAHYLDLAGEVPRLFDRLRARAAIAHRAGLVLMPGVGFDVVADAIAWRCTWPGGCRAPRPRDRRAGRGGLSRGTALTMLEAAPQGGFVRRAGRLVQVRAAWRTRTVDLGAGRCWPSARPWATCRAPTIPPASRASRLTPRAAGAGAAVARDAPPGGRCCGRAGAAGRRFGATLVETGPREAARRDAVAHVWTQVADSRGRTATPRFTRRSRPPSRWRRLWSQCDALPQEVQPGFRTPAGAFGPDYVLQFPRVTPGTSEASSRPVALWHHNPRVPAAVCGQEPGGLEALTAPLAECALRWLNLTIGTTTGRRLVSS